MLPRAKELLIFRNKHTAHRSIDYPRKNETVESRERQAMAFGFYRINDKDSFPLFQIQDEQTHITFNMRDDHTVLMGEAMALLQSLYPVPTDA